MQLALLSGLARAQRRRSAWLRPSCAEPLHADLLRRRPRLIEDAGLGRWPSGGGGVWGLTGASSEQQLGSLGQAPAQGPQERTASEAG